jgi:hypothetical protein
VLQRDTHSLLEELTEDVNQKAPHTPVLVFPAERGIILEVDDHHPLGGKPDRGKGKTNENKGRDEKRNGYLTCSHKRIVNSFPLSVK